MTAICAWLVVCWASFGTAQVPPPTVPIKGVVVSASDNTPVIGAKVVFAQAGKVVQSTVSDQSGAFDVLVPSAKLVVSAEADGFLPSWYQGASDSAATIEIDGRAPGSTLRIRLFKAPKIQGKVVDQAQAPVGAVRVQLYSVREAAGRLAYTELAETRTTASGEFSIVPPAPGKFIVSAGVRVLTIADPKDSDSPELGARLALRPNSAKPAGVVAGMALSADGPANFRDAEGLHALGWGFSGGAEEPDLAAPFDVDAGDVVDITIVLAQQRWRWLEGTIEGARPGVVVTAAFSTNGQLARQLDVAGTLTTEGGRFRMLLPDRSLSIRSTTLDGFVNVPIIWSPDTAVTRVALTLEPFAAIDGSIVFTSGGREVERPVGTLRAIFEPEFGGLREPIRRANVQPDGTFAITGLTGTPGFVRIYGLPPEAVVTATTINSDRLTLGEQKIRVSGGVPVSVKIEIDPAGPSLSGEVTGARLQDGRGTVLVFPQSPTAWRDFGINPPSIRECPVENGRFSCLGIPKGEYFAVAVKGAIDPNWRVAARLSTLSTGAMRIKVTAAERVNLKFLGR